MSEKLKIYACSGIGETDKKTSAYWTDGTNSVSNTQAVNTLLAKINLAWAEYTNMRDLSQADKLELLNEIDWLSVALDAAKRFSGDNEKLLYAGVVISQMAADGAFDGQSTDLREREDRLEELIEKANKEYTEDNLSLAAQDQEFMRWWKETIVARNKVGLNFGQQQNVRRAIKEGASQIKGIGAADESWRENQDIAQYLTQAGRYFTYIYFTNEQLAKVPDIFRLRAAAQRRVYNYCKAYFVNVYGSEEDMQDIIRAGIIKDSKGVSPEEICAKIAGTPKKVGSVTVSIVIGIKEIITILTLAIGFILGIVKLICDCVYKSNVAKYAAMRDSIINQGGAQKDDFEDLDIGGNTMLSKDNNKWFSIAAVAAGLLLLIIKR